MNREAVVVIPIYRMDLSVTEQVSLTQVQRVLGQYDICFIAPEGLASDGFLSGRDRRHIEYFDARYFESKNTYSELMLSTDLYERFSDYDYMLLYQLDAFVFSNRLSEFCAMGYDYIGAPFCSRSENWGDVGCNIGNGGFSLRKIDSALRILKKKERVFQKLPSTWKKNLFLAWEDLFFAYCSTIPELDFHVPDFHTALDFAAEMDIGHAYKKMPKWMPFGCHAWNTIGYWFWKPLIESYGYTLPEPTNRQMVHERKRKAERYIMERLLRPSSHRQRSVFLELRRFVTGGHHSIALWGWGVYGKLVAELFQTAGYKVEIVFDRKAGTESNECAMKFAQPDFELIQERGYFVIVTTTKYEDEICAEMMAHEMEEGRDYGRISVMMDMLGKAYLRSFSYR